MDGVEDLEDGPGLALSPPNRGLRLAFRPQDGRLLLPLGGEDRGLFDALGGEDRGAAIALGLHLLLHRALDAARGLDRLEFDASDSDSPLACRLVEDAAELTVDLIPPRESLLHVHRSDDVSQRSRSELLDGFKGIGYSVCSANGIGHLVIDDRVDRHVDVIGGNDRLRRKGHDLLAHVDPLADRVEERHQEVKAWLECALVLSEPFDDDSIALFDHQKRFEYRYYNDKDYKAQNYETDVCA